MTVEAPPAPPAERRGWARPLIAVLAAVGLLLFGAAAGLLIGLPGSSATSMPAADSVDVGFAQDMSVHHQQAVQMASWERDHTTDPALKQLAFDIETTQLQQIGRMQGWLGLWGMASDAPGGKHMAWMASPDHSHSMTAGRRRRHDARHGDVGPAPRPARGRRPTRWTCCSCSSCSATTRAA